MWFLRVNVLLLSVFVAAAVQAADGQDYGPYPKPDSGYVTDYANLLTKDEEESIEVLLWQLESRTGVEIIVVTINSIRDYETPHRTIEDFAKGLFDAYKIGNMPKNNRVLLLVAKNDHKAHIELGAGYGHDYDNVAARIMQNDIIPPFKQGDYVGGMNAGVTSLAREFGHVRIVFPWHIALVVGLGALSLITGVSLIASGKTGWGWVFIGLAILLLLFILYVIIQIARYMPKSDSDSWAPGGIGGFGGGFSGGGGATGSW